MEAQSINELNPREREIIKQIILLFHDEANGYKNKLTNDQVLFRLLERGIKLPDSKFRDFLGFIRRTDACTKYLKKYKNRLERAFIVSSNLGYWWSEDRQERIDFWKSQHGRVCEIMSNCRPIYQELGFNLDQLLFQFENIENKETKAA